MSSTDVAERLLILLFPDSWPPVAPAADLTKLHKSWLHQLWERSTSTVCKDGPCDGNPKTSPLDSPALQRLGGVEPCRAEAEQ